MLREFQRYRNLIGRPNIGSVLMSERQTLLAQLTTHVEHLEGDFESRTNGGRGGSDSSPPRGRNTSHKINCVVWGKQLRNKITQLLKTATPLLKDLGHSFNEFRDLANTLIDKVGKWVKDRVVEWDRDMQDHLEGTFFCVVLFIFWWCGGVVVWWCGGGGGKGCVCDRKELNRSNISFDRKITLPKELLLRKKKMFAADCCSMTTTLLELPS